VSGDLVRVHLVLKREALEDLERLVRYRHGGRSRSEVVREAISWLRAKEAAWLLRARRQEELQAKALAELEAARGMGAIERQRLREEEALSAALRIVDGAAE